MNNLIDVIIADADGIALEIVETILNGGAVEQALKFSLKEKIFAKTWFTFRVFWVFNERQSTNTKYKNKNQKLKRGTKKMARRKINYFKNVETVEALKRLYKKLVFEFHPDRNKQNDTTAIMQDINSEYDYLFKKVKDIHEGIDKDTKQKTTYTAKVPTSEAPDDFRNILYALIKIENIIVELCGRWLWISGETKACKDILKTLGCRYNANKQMWSWHYPEDSTFKKHKVRSMKYIREVYGSTEYEKEEQALLTA